MQKYKPLAQVRKKLLIKWYRCPIERQNLRAFTNRNDLKGWFYSEGNLIILAITAFLTYYFYRQQIWVGFGVMLWVHGTIFSFIPGLATHELSHGTVFKTKWLNGFFLRIYSLLGWVDFHHYKRSHTYHHLYTLHPEGDREVVLPGNPSLKALRLLYVFTFNFTGFWLVLRNTMRLAFQGKFSREWSDAIFPPEDVKGRKAAIRWARMIVLFHAGVIVLSVLLQIWILPLLVTFAGFTGNWWKYFIGITMHTGLRDNVPDFRKCCRTILLDPFSRFIYWNMNYHTEHHMYAAVPCYNLKKLKQEVAWDMPKPRTLVAAWKEMRKIYHRQQTEPDYQYDTPIPDHDREDKLELDPLAASIGDLAPKSLA